MKKLDIIVIAVLIVLVILVTVGVRTMIYISPEYINLNNTESIQMYYIDVGENIEVVYVDGDGIIVEKDIYEYEDNKCVLLTEILYATNRANTYNANMSDYSLHDGVYVREVVMTGNLSKSEMRIEIESNMSTGTCIK